MGSASDRSPDPTRTTNWARLPLPTGLRRTASAPSPPRSPIFDHSDFEPVMWLVIKGEK